MKNFFGLCTIAFVVEVLAVPCGAGEVGDYLRKDGKLKEAVTIRLGGRQFLAPPEEIWTIKPSGEWAWEFTDSKGKFSARQIAALAQHLASQDFNTLPKSQGFQPKETEGGYDYVKIAFGKTEAAFFIKTGKSTADYLPNADDPKAAAWSRFIALKLVLTDLLQMSNVRAEYK